MLYSNIEMFQCAVFYKSKRSLKSPSNGASHLISIARFLKKLALLLLHPDHSLISCKEIKTISVVSEIYERTEGLRNKIGDY